MSRARILWISGPVLRARAEGPFAMREAVAVGPQGLVGEVIRLEGDELVAQVDVSNQTILAAEARVRQARALVDIARAPFGSRVVLPRVLDAACA